MGNMCVCVCVYASTDDTKWWWVEMQRLESVYESDPLVYSNMVEVLKKEMNDGIARKLTSCSRAFLWLTRYLLMFIHQIVGCFLHFC